MLLEAERRKCDFLEQWAPPNARVVWGRAEEQEHGLGRRRPREGARAAAGRGRVVPAARPRRAAIAVLWVGETAEPERVARVAERLAAEPVDSPAGLLVLRKLGPTPAGLPAPHRAWRGERPLA